MAKDMEQIVDRFARRLRVRPFCGAVVGTGEIQMIYTAVSNM